MTDPRVQFLYSEALRAEDDQFARMEALHSKTATLLGAAALSTAVFGGAVPDRQLEWPGYTALALFLVQVFVCVYLLVPRSQWSRGLRIDELVKQIDDLNAPEDVLLRSHALNRYAAVRANELTIQRLHNVFLAGAICLPAEIVLFAVQALRWMP